MAGRALAALLSASAEVGESLTELLAGGRPQQPALIVPDSAEVLTYAQVASRVEALAQRLADLTVRRGDRVALALPNGPDVVLLLLAITALGAAAAPLNPAYTEAEFGFFLDDIAPRLLLIPASGSAAASAAAATAGTTLVGVRPDGDGPPRLLYDGGPVELTAFLRARRCRRRGGRAAHQRHHQQAKAGSAAAAQPDGLGADDRRALPAGASRRVVLRDAAVPHPRPGRIHVRGARIGRRGHHAPPVHAAAASGRRPGSTAPPGYPPVPRSIR